MATRNRVIAKQRKRQQQRKFLYGIVACVVILATILAVVAQRNDESSASNAPQTDPVTITGAALPAYDSTKTDPAVGTTIPALAGTSLIDGTPVRVANDGKPKVLLFVAHWCPHCQREVPLLAGDLHKTPLPAGVEMITISTGVDAAAPNTRRRSGLRLCSGRRRSSRTTRTAAPPKRSVSAHTRTSCSSTPTTRSLRARPVRCRWPTSAATSPHCSRRELLGAQLARRVHAVSWPGRDRPR